MPSSPPGTGSCGFPISHAFHTRDRGSGVRAAPRAVLAGLDLQPATAAHRRQRVRRVLPGGARRRLPDARHAGRPDRFAGAVREGPSDAVRRRARGCSSSWDRSRRSTGSSRTCSAIARTSSHCSRITRNQATWSRSTTPCAACTPRDWGPASRPRERRSSRLPRGLRRDSDPGAGTGRPGALPMPSRAAFRFRSCGPARDLQAHRRGSWVPAAGWSSCPTGVAPRRS